MQTTRIPRPLAAWLLALGLLLAGVPALATTYYVANSGNNTNAGTDPAFPKQHIQVAINVTRDFDTVLVFDGIYTGNGDKNLDFYGKKITVRSASNNPSLCIINCEGNGSGFILHNSETSAAVISGFTIQNASNSGMFNISSSPTVTNCTFTGNRASYYGGGMYNQYSSNPTVTNCTFSENSADLGGGMYNEGKSPTVTNCTFSGNHAGLGGGMFNDDSSSPIITNCTFSGNRAVSGGGGMSNDSGSSPTVINCTFNANRTDYDRGGGMLNWYSNSTVINCTFIGNHAGSVGGGMFNISSNPTVTNCTFTRNGAGYYGGGMYNQYGSSPMITNCILWGDTGGEIGNADSSPTITYSDVQGGYPGTANIVTDPCFLNAATGNLRLQPTSPCINTGDSTVVTCPPFLTNEEGILVDLAGNPRIQYGSVDMGAYEVQAITSTVSGTVTLEEMSASAPPPMLTFTFRSVDTGGGFERSVTLGENGAFTLTDIPSIDYIVHIKGMKWLAQNQAINTTNGDVTSILATLKAADANNDNYVDVFDLDLLIQSFDATPTDPNWNAGVADFNCDGVVDVNDLNLLIQNFDAEGDP